MKKYIVLFFVLFLLGIVTVKAQYSDLYDFNGYPTDGANPHGSLTLSGKTFYGMTLNGGYGWGCLFSVDTDGSNYKVLHKFSDTTGGWPYGSLIISGNVLYGMTSNFGVPSGIGTVFSINTNGSNYKTLYSFTNANGNKPLGSLILSGNILYGTTSASGTHGFGNIFSIDTLGTGYTDLYDFTGVSGGYPYGSLILSGNTLFGTARGGWPANDSGGIFSINKNGTGYKLLYTFYVTTGSYPMGDLTLAGGTLFGMTMMGSINNDGNIFSIDTNGTKFTILHNFNGVNGKYPHGSLTLSGNTLFGMTSLGGAHDSGSIFSYDTLSGNYLDLYDFANGIVLGGIPYGNILCSGSSLYGMVSTDGTASFNGVIFRFKDTLLLGIDALKTLSGNIYTYPNPGSGKFTIQSTVVNKQLSVQVYNMLGEKVFSQFNIQNPTFKIDLSNQRNGVYFYKAIDIDGAVIGEGKLIIQK